MLRSKVFTVQKTVDDLDISIDLLDSCSKPLSSTKHRGNAVSASAVTVFPVDAFFCWKLSLKISAPVAVVVSGVQNRNSSSRSVSPSYLS